MPMQPDTRKLLRTGLLIFGTGVVAAALIFTASAASPTRARTPTSAGSP